VPPSRNWESLSSLDTRRGQPAEAPLRRLPEPRPQQALRELVQDHQDGKEEEREVGSAWDHGFICVGEDWIDVLLPESCAIRANF
jgi:hypothetical protein